MSATALGRTGVALIFLAGLVVSSLRRGEGGRLSVPLLAIWTLGCITRILYGDRQLATDVWVSLGWAVWVGRMKLLETRGKRWNHIVGWEVGVATVGLAYVALILWSSRKGAVRVEEPLPATAEKWTKEHPRAKIFPCRTTHARMFPKKHAFSYSYLQVGFPIIPEAVTAGGMHISTGKDHSLGSWWLRVKAEDYLDRGNGELGFYGKLKMYLRDQHVKDTEWCYAYLLSAPRFFGYAFNPVSFWYIYDAEHQLKKMILEVNNTFGERRMYLLDGSTSPTPPRTAGPEVSGELESEVSEDPKSRFTDVWMKDFHVSPFNSRKGSYALKALNPFPCATCDDPKIDNTITLKSDKDHGKLVARLFSTDKAIDLETMGLEGTIRFVRSWFWVGFVTFPRIVREAGKLFFKRKLNVFFRPEVQTTSMGRLPTDSEIILHKAFSAYLHELVAQTEETFCITFRAGIPNVPVEIITTKRGPTPARPIRNLEIRVLTPAFYSRLVHYAYTSEAIDRECVFTDERNRTLWLCRPQLLPLLLLSKSSLKSTDTEHGVAKRNYLDELRWGLLKRLRCAPPDPVYSATPQSLSVNDIRSRPFSELDSFVRSEKGSVFSEQYRRTVTKIFLAQRFALGFSETVGSLDLLIGVLLSYFAVAQIFGSVVWPVKSMESLVSQRGWRSPRDSGWWLVWSTAVVLSPHTYQMLKGYR